MINICYSSCRFASSGVAIETHVLVELAEKYRFTPNQRKDDALGSAATIDAVSVFNLVCCVFRLYL